MSVLNETRRYHHGDLKTALLTEAETILERDGIQALTLRATARAAGVSHAAPTNHFGDLTGLLSELAAVGYNRFSDALENARAAGGDTGSQDRGVGRAYVTFARAYPGLFALMFRSERLDLTRPALGTAMERARLTLRPPGPPRAEPLPPLKAMAQAAARWSLVHGFATLLLDGRLSGMLRALPDQSVDDLLEAMLDVTRIGA